MMDLKPPVLVGLPVLESALLSAGEAVRLPNGKIMLSRYDWERIKNAEPGGVEEILRGIKLVNKPIDLPE